MSEQSALPLDGLAPVQRAIINMAKKDALAKQEQSLITNVRVSPDLTPGVRWAAPSGMEQATVFRAEFIDRVAIKRFPNFSSIINYRSNGEGVRFYDTMLGTDADLRGLYQDMVDAVLHYPMWVRAAYDVEPYLTHAAFIDFARKYIPNFQNAARHMLTNHARGFSVTEKIYEVVQRGRWTGAVVFGELLDDPQRWFDFNTDRQLLLITGKAWPGELMPQTKFVILPFGSNSNPWGEATLDHAYWAWYLKHHALKNQAIFYEKWAQPNVVVDYKWNANQEVNQQNIEEALAVAERFQAQSVTALPEGMNLRLIESLRQGAISYADYINQLTEMESRAVTGQILTLFGAKGGSYALGKVHEKRLTNKTHMLGQMLSHQVSRMFRELIDRNFGPQDAYPQVKIFTLDPLEKQAAIENEKGLMQNGHKLSAHFSDEFFEVVPPMDPTDELTAPPEAAGAQTLPVNPTLEEPEIHVPQKYIFLEGKKYLEVEGEE